MSAVADDTRQLEAQVADYLAADWKLCGIEGGKKCPSYKSWQTTPLDADQLSIYPGVGILLAHSGKCTLDVDNYESAKKWLAERDVDLDVLINAADAVRIESGRAGRTKLLYRLSKPLTTKRVVIDGNTILEFRCASSTGGSSQDVLPCSIHPNTRKPYRWAFGEPLLGDWRNPPVIPATLLAAWRELGGKHVQLAIPSVVLPSRAFAQLKEGFVTTFGNGQKWTLHNGQARQVQ
jgi:bifunctional DNA primase/polymerase-like protein